MSKILVNALSVTNQSGLHVLAGHLEQFIQSGISLVVIARPEDRIRQRFGGRVEWLDASKKTEGWLARAIWEFRFLEKVAKEVQAQFYLTPSGIAASRLSIPQVVLCQNPWALVPSARSRKDAMKAWLQRRAYRTTMQNSDVMVFNSKYMQRAYRANAGFNEKQGIIAYQSADDETRCRAEQWKDTARVVGQICCVSAMAPHKNVETVVHAFAKLVLTESTSSSPRISDLRSLTSDLSLRLVGSWPDLAYEKKIRRLVSTLGLEKQVRFDGFVSREELDRIYAESQVFCLMSRCESFGIPAIEAQLFGTPVVCSTVCAIPEICGDGGLFCDPDDVTGIADALEILLTDDGVWRKYSVQARRNAARFKWDECSRHLADVFSDERRKVE